MINTDIVPLNLQDGFKLLEEYNILPYIEEMVWHRKYNIYQISTLCTNTQVNLKQLYFEGYSWEIIDIFRGDCTSLIPYIAYSYKLRKESEPNLILMKELLETVGYKELIYGIIELV